MTERAVVLQASDLLVRGDRAVPPDTRGPDGEPANALLATVKALRRTLAMKLPDRALAVLGPEPIENELAAQYRRLPELLEAHGFEVLLDPKPTATAAAWVNTAVAKGCEVVVVGYDKRLAQLVAEGVWFYDAYKDVRYTPDRVAKRFGVGPGHVAEWLALVGDNYATAGIKGVGAKGAVTLLGTHGSVEAALEALDGIKGRTGNALRAAGVEAVRRAVLQARLDGRAPEAPPAWTAPDPARLDELYRSLGFLNLVRAPAAAAVPVVSNPEAPTTLASLQVVTGTPSPVRGALVGLAIATESGVQYVPATELESLRSWLEDASAPKIGHDIKGATVALRRHGLDLRGIVGDTCIVSHLLDPSGRAPHELPDLARAVLQRPLKTPDEVLGKGARRKRWESLDPARTAAWAGARAEAALELWAALADSVNAALLQDALDLSEVLVGMELRGMPVDRANLEQSGVDFEAIGAQLEQEIFALAGHPFTINSTKQLGQVLYAELGLPVVARTKTGWSTANHALERLEGAHPIVPLVIRWRRLRRLRDSWITALGKAIDPDGRVRSTFHPARSFSGRLVNSHPDLGRVPGRTPEMERIRQAFRAPPGHSLLSIDYDQLGLYVIAHLANEPNLVGPLIRGEDLHVATAAAVLELDPVDVGAPQRDIGKLVNFATFAGQGASALALQLGVDAPEAKRLIARFFDRYAATRLFLDAQLELASSQGYVTTLAGRRWHIHDLTSKNPMTRGYAERLARRATHEGSVADVTRQGLLNAARALQEAGLSAVPLVQIHDEVLFEVPNDELGHACRTAGPAMCAAYPLVVPLRVGFKSGPSWGELRALPNP